MIFLLFSLFLAVLADEIPEQTDLAKAMFKDVNWVREKGDFVHGQAAVGWTEDTGFGFYAVSNVTGGSQILRFALPPEKSVIISLQSIKDGDPEFYSSPEISQLVETAVDGEYLVLAIFLLHEVEKQEDSFWFPHLRLLKDVNVHNALFFTDEDLFWLQSSMVSQTIVDHQYAIRDAYESLLKDYDLSSVLSDFSFAQFMWAINIVNTRSIRIQTYHKEDNDWADDLSIVPVLDFCNFSPLGDPYNVECFTNDASSRFICRARYDVWPKEQFLVGLPTALVQEGNQRLLVDHGFVDFSTPMKLSGSSISIDNLTPKDAYRHQVAVDVFGNNLAQFEDLQFWAIQGREVRDILTSNLLVLARIAVLTGDEIGLYGEDADSYRATMNYVLSERRELSIDNEILAVSLVGKAVESRYLTYYTSLKQDYALLDLLKGTNFICNSTIVSEFKDKRNDFTPLFLTEEEIEKAVSPFMAGVCSTDGATVTKIQQLALHYRMEEKHLIKRIITILSERKIVLEDAKANGNSNIFMKKVEQDEMGPY